MPEPTSQPVESPCVKVCVLDQHNVCVGCGRTLEEIAAWSRAAPEEQRAIRRAAAERLLSARVGVAGRGG